MRHIFGVSLHREACTSPNPFNHQNIHHTVKLPITNKILKTVVFCSKAPHTPN
jgi:hypothetical protein